MPEMVGYGRRRKATSPRTPGGTVRAGAGMGSGGRLERVMIPSQGGRTFAKEFNVEYSDRVHPYYQGIRNSRLKGESSSLSAQALNNQPINSRPTVSRADYNDVLAARRGAPAPAPDVLAAGRGAPASTIPRPAGRRSIPSPRSRPGAARTGQGLAGMVDAPLSRMGILGTQARLGAGAASVAMGRRSKSSGWWT